MMQHWLRQTLKDAMWRAESAKSVLGCWGKRWEPVLVVSPFSRVDKKKIDLIETHNLPKSSSTLDEPRNDSFHMNNSSIGDTILPPFVQLI